MNLILEMQIVSVSPLQRLSLYTRFFEQNPSPTTELNYRSPFELLTAVMLSAQATDTSVNKATEKLFKIANTPETILALGLDRLKTYLKTLNYYHTKAKHLMAASAILIQEYDGKIPTSRKTLETLPGVGRKTANVILNALFDKPVIAVDTHIFRVANRTGLAPGLTPLAVETKLTKITPKKFQKHAHHWLILHGRYICTARNPKCSHCCIQDLCEYKSKNVKK